MTHGSLYCPNLLFSTQDFAEDTTLENFGFALLESDSKSVEFVFRLFSADIMDDYDTHEFNSGESSSVWYSYDEADTYTDLDREWNKRRDKFYTIGYRDGTISAKDAVEGDGFATGFKRSVASGYKWGLVRGVTSAFSCLPESLKRHMVESQEKRELMQEVHKYAASLSTARAFKSFLETVPTPDVGDISGSESPCGPLQLEECTKKLKSALEPHPIASRFDD